MQWTAQPVHTLRKIAGNKHLDEKSPQQFHAKASIENNVKRKQFTVVS
jgi:hypothetical protein